MSVFYKALLTNILITFLFFTIHAQNLPDAWKFYPEESILKVGGDNDDGFFGQYELQAVELEFQQPNWWQLLEENYDTATDLLATCWINGIQYDSVGVRFKGATSYFRNDTEKKSFNITLDYIIDGQDIEGYNTFNLNCGWDDNSSMREVLYNNIGQQYSMSLKSNYANLSINGENWGPYQNIQQFDSDYIKEWFLSNDGTIWRAERTDFVPGQGGGGGMGGPNFGAGESTLNYNGPDSTDYNTDYTLKRTEIENPWEGLINACDVLNNTPLEFLEEELSKVLDIDKACWFLAHEIIFSDDDSYINKGGMDYYVYYEAETGRIIPMEYDGNSVLNPDLLNWNLFYNEDNTDFPLMNRMLAVPSIRQRYLSHVRVILEEYFNSNFIDDRIDTWATLIDELVQEDPKKFYSYNEFQSSIPALKQAIITRRNSLSSDTELNGVTPLTIDDVSYLVEGNPWQTPTELNEVEVLAHIAGTAGIESVWLHYGEGLTGTFTQLEMFDDGLHNDGAAQDGQYGSVIPARSIGTYVRFYIEAIAADNSATATYEPKGAEYNVFLYQVGLESTSSTSVVINELMAQNDNAVQDSFGEYDDWFELYNLSSSDIDLSGWTVTDDINTLDKFTFPEGTIIASNAYLIVWADEDEEQDGLHSNFKLSANGESLYLLNDMEELVDEVNFPEAITDLSYARTPNGVGSFEYKAHTFGENNDLISGLSNEDKAFDILVYPNPAHHSISIASEKPISSTFELEVFNVNGQRVYTDSGNKFTTHTIALSEFNTGIYFIHLQVGSELITDKFIKM